jgi:2-oxoglutarate ferredoxin oxidoreductase subunit alpha
MDHFYRYLDVDGDGIPYRTLPGVHPKGSYFTRGSGHTSHGAYTENSAEYKEVVDRLLLKWETARATTPAPVIQSSKFNKSGIIAVGSSDGAVREALDSLGEKKIGLNYCRVKAFPFNDDVRDFIDNHETVYVVEQNRDAQLRSMLMLDLDANPDKLVSILHYDGMPISASFVAERIEEEVARGRAA